MLDKIPFVAMFPCAIAPYCVRKFEGILLSTRYFSSLLFYSHRNPMDLLLVPVHLRYVVVLRVFQSLARLFSK